MKMRRVGQSQNSSEIQDLLKETKRARAEWENIRMEERPFLPKVSVNRKVELLIKQANQAIRLRRYPTSITSTCYFKLVYNALHLSVVEILT